MAISWGTSVNYEQVGIQVRTSSYSSSTTSITVYVDYYVRTLSRAFQDDQKLTLSGKIGGSYSFTLSTTNGSTQQRLIGTKTFTQSLSYSGGPTHTFTAKISGQYLGGTPYKTYKWTTPKRPASDPGAPPVSISSVSSSSAKVNVSNAATNGSSIVEYQGQYSKSSSFSGATTWSGGSRTISGLDSGTRYYVRVRARNGVGWGSWSSTKGFTTGATKPDAPSLSSVTGVTQTGANLSWSAPDDGGSDIDYYQFQLATNSSFSGASTYNEDARTRVLEGRTPGTTYWVRVRAVNGVGAGSWSNVRSFSTLAGTPKIIGPKTTTDAKFSFTIESIGMKAGRVLEVQASTTSAFTAGTVESTTYTKSTPSSNNQYTVTKAGVYYPSGTYYVRARISEASSGYVSPWSTTLVQTRTHQPAVALGEPETGSTMAYSAVVPLAIRYSDPAASDMPSAYRMWVEDNNTGDTLFDTGKTAPPSPASNPQIITVNVPISEDLKNDPIRWRAQVWDTGDQASAVSGYSIVTLSDPPVITIIEPAPLSSIETGAPTVSWDFVSLAGGTQAWARVEVYDDVVNELIWDADVAGTGSTVSPDTVILVNGRRYRVEITAADTYGLVTSAATTFETNYVTPAPVEYTIDADAPNDTGYILVSWANAAPDALFAQWKVYRTVNGGKWEVVAIIANQSVREYRDYMLRSGDTYMYSVTQTANRSGTLLEGPVGYYGAAEAVDEDGDPIAIPEDRMFDVELSNYWIICQDQPSLSLHMIGVIQDESTLEFESETTHIIGRGRHTDYGDELGYTGTLVCQVLIPERESMFRRRVEELRRAQETYHLRTPFGRIFQVSLGDIAWSPRAGSGTSDMGQLTLPYQEVS